MAWVPQRSHCGCNGKIEAGGRQELASGGTPSPAVGAESSRAQPRSQAFSESPGPLLCLQVDILVMAEPSSGRWVHLDTEITNSSGRITYSVPRPRRLGVGVYPVKMVVR